MPILRVEVDGRGRKTFLRIGDDLFYNLATSKPGRLVFNTWRMLFFMTKIGRLESFPRFVKEFKAAVILSDPTRQYWRGVFLL